MRNRRWQVGVMLLASCGGSKEPEPSTVAEGDFVSVYVQAFCDGLEGCCTAASTTFNRAACRTEMTSKAEDHIKVRSSSSVYDGKRASQCIEEIGSLMKGCLTSSFVMNAFSAACNSVRVGTLPTGASCTANDECAPSEQGPGRCVVPTSTLVGECIVDRPGSSGDHCVGSSPQDPNIPATQYHADCGDGLYCDPNDLCVPRFAEGAVCMANPNCGETLWCRPSELGAPQPLMSHCSPKEGLGSRCSFPQQCTSGSCYQQQCVEGEPVAPLACFQ